jgi:hypothetical protein
MYCALLRRAAQCSAVLRNAAPCCVVLCCAVLFWGVLRRDAPCCAVVLRAVPCCAVLRHSRLFPIRTVIPTSFQMNDDSLDGSNVYVSPVYCALYILKRQTKLM